MLLFLILIILVLVVIALRLMVNYRGEERRKEESQAINEYNQAKKIEFKEKMKNNGQIATIELAIEMLKNAGYNILSGSSSVSSSGGRLIGHTLRIFVELNDKTLGYLEFNLHKGLYPDQEYRIGPMKRNPSYYVYDKDGLMVVGNDCYGKPPEWFKLIQHLFPTHFPAH